MTEINDFGDLSDQIDLWALILEAAIAAENQVRALDPPPRRGVGSEPWMG